MWACRQVIYLIARPKRQITRQSSSVPSTVNDTGLVNVRESEIVDLVLRKHNDERHVDRLRKEYLRVSKEITVEVLKRFLGRKLSYSYPAHFQVRKKCEGLDNAE